MMIVTGAAGMLGSCMISKLNQHNFNHIIAVDNFYNPEAEHNLYRKKIQERIATHQLLPWLAENYREVEFIFHLGSSLANADDRHAACAESTKSLTRELWQLCIHAQIPFIFDLTRHEQSPDFSEPWISAQDQKPFFWAGLQLPAVYGPNEYYLQEKASIIYRGFKRWQEDKHHWEALFDQEAPPQDLVYVKDVVEVCYFLMRHRQHAGIYTLHTGNTYHLHEIKEIMTAVFSGHEPSTEEKSIQESTPPGLQQLRAIGYHHSLRSLTEGVRDYVVHYLQEKKYD